MDSDSFSLFSFLMIFVLLFLNAFFVASEFAVVKVRETRIDELIKGGNRRAKFVKKVLTDLDTHLAAAQLGITLTSLGIGAVAEPAFEKLLELVFNSLIPEEILGKLAFLIGFLIATVLHIIIGEQVPKVWAIEKSESMSLWTTPLLYAFCKVMYPFIKILDLLAKLVLRILGVESSKGHEVHSTEEIKMILSNSSEMEPDEQIMFNRVFDFHEQLVRDVIVHRKHMEVISINDSIEDSLKVILNSHHSRFPVCGDDRDDIKGYINVKDLYRLTSEQKEINLADIIREIPKIFETIPIKRALALLQKENHQMAIVMDEYGGVAGLLTVEDIIEVIVGEIQDEFDVTVEV